jgi:hypothetical protein
MKTNSAARRFVRIRGIMMCLAFAGMIGMAFGLGESLAARFGRRAAPQTAAPPAPTVNLDSLVCSR